MAADSKNSTTRFTDRVDAYVKYRPSYPAALLQGLAAEVGLTPADTLADIGSGTGLLTRLFLDHGNTVIGVEPNDAMRAAGDTFLNGYTGFRSLKGTAESTGLAKHSVQGVIAGQAFHWFDPPRARAEFLRILRPGGWVALIWNSRPPDGTRFLRAYEKFTAEFGTDYGAVNHTATVSPAMLQEFFGASECRRFEYPNQQVFDFDGLLGRVRSSSYMPTETHANYPAMVAAVRTLFDAEQSGGKVLFDYVTEMFVGTMAG